MKVKSLVVFLSYLFCAVNVCAQQSSLRTSGPALLTYDEIIQLYQQDVLAGPLSDKLQTLLTTPFVSNRAFERGVRPLKPVSPETGKFLRVVEWI